MTEIPERFKDCLFYDGNCPFCLNTLTRFKPLLERRGIKQLPLQAEQVQQGLNLTDEKLLEEMKFVDGKGELHGGADALLCLARMYWWSWPLFAMAKFPGVTPIFHAAYKQFAKGRYCLSGTCALPAHRPTGIPKFAWIPALLLVLLAFPFINTLPPWVFMWLLAGMIFAACKWLTWFAAKTITARKTFKAMLCYLFLWPGMDPRPFLQPARTVKDNKAEWAFALGKIALGIILLATITRRVEHPVAAGWVGMIGFAFMVHFGLFHCLALAWRRRGVPVHPLMNKPALATSLTDLWGRRWNRGFNELVHRFVFVPSFRRLTIPGATLLTFAVSGLIHDLVIAVPARAGYGMPTLYFVLQGFGILIERSNFGRKIGIDHGFRGWLFMAVFTLGPVYWLFSPAFVLNVFNPFLKAIGAL